MQESSERSQPDPMWSAEHFIGRVMGAILGEVGAAAEAVRLWHSRRALGEELNRLGERELDDLGIVRGQIPTLVAAYPEAPRLLMRMLRQVGIDDERVGTALLRELERTCANCVERKACRHWLKAPTPAGDYRRFCPNAAVLEKLANEQAAARRSAMEGVF